MSAQIQADLAVALERHQAGRLAEAEPLYRAVLDQAPGEPTGLYLYGMLSFETGRADQAGALFARLVEAAPNNAEGWFALANLLCWRDQRGPAIEAYQRAATLDPAHAGARLNLAKALRDEGRFDEAIETCQAALDVGIDPAAANTLLGGVLLAAGRHAAAVLAFETASAADPAGAEARLGLATALLGADRAAEALAAADAVIAADDSLAEAWMLRGAALSGLRRAADAVPVLERAVALDPDRAGTCLSLGNAYAELDRAADAERELLAALSLDPALKEAHASLGSVYMRAERKQAAELCFLFSLENDPEMVVPHQNLAALMAEQGRLDEARRHRDIAYRRQHLFVEQAPDPVLTVLALTGAEGGNVPHRFLLPNDRYTRLEWFVEYAEADEAARLPAFDLVFNAIGDPDLAAAGAPQTERFLASYSGPVLNPPDRVARTFRHRTGELLSGLADVVVPRTVRIAAAEASGGDLLDRLADHGLAPPLLMRPIGSHGGRGMTLIDSADALAEMPTPDSDIYVTAYHDFASRDGWSRKYRAIFVDRRPYPYHLAISRDWLVHYGTAGMVGDAERLAEEVGFLEDPALAIGARAWAAIAAIGRRLDLDYGGIDFSVLPDGRAVVFEANAAMLVHSEADDGPLAHKNLFVATILDAFADMLARAANR